MTAWKEYRYCPARFQAFQSENRTDSQVCPNIGPMAALLIGLAVPMSRRIPKRQLGFGLGFLPRHADIVQDMVIKGSQSQTLVAQCKGVAQTLKQRCLQWAI